jgi:hypothetical protein
MLYFLAIRFKWYAIFCNSSSDVAIKMWSSAYSMVSIYFLLFSCIPFFINLFFKNFKIIFLLSPFEKLHHSSFYLSILFSTLFSNTTFQTHLQPSLRFPLWSMFLTHKQQHSKYNFLKFVFYLQTNVIRQSSSFLLLNITLATLIRCIISSLFSPSSVIRIKINN